MNKIKKILRNVLIFFKKDMSLNFKQYQYD